MNDKVFAMVGAGSTLSSPGRSRQHELIVRAGMLGQRRLALLAPVLDPPDSDFATSRASFDDATTADPSTLQEFSS